MNKTINILLSLFYLCVNCVSVSQEWNTLDVYAFQTLTKANERWIRETENRLEKNCDKKIQSLEKNVKELSKQVKQQALYQEHTEKLELIVREQEKTISKLKVERMHIKKVGTVNRNVLVPTEDEREKVRTTEGGVLRQPGVKQCIRSFMKQSKISLID